MSDQRPAISVLVRDHRDQDRKALRQLVAAGNLMAMQLRTLAERQETETLPGERDTINNAWRELPDTWDFALDRLRREKP